MHTSSLGWLRSPLVHVTHQSAVCSPQPGSGGRAEECSLCAILGHTGCSSSVTTAVHGCVFASFGRVRTVDAGVRVRVCFLCVRACVSFFSCAFAPQLCRCTCLSIAHFRTTASCLQLQMNGNHFGRTGQSIVTANLSINGQPLAGICHCLTLSGHFKLVLISHSQVWVP